MGTSHIRSLKLQERKFVFLSESHPASGVMACNLFTHSHVLALRKGYNRCLVRASTNAVVPIFPFRPPSLEYPSSRHIVNAHYSASEAPQRSEEWFALRKDKLTTSTFSTALGFWQPMRRSELWCEKVFPSNPIVFNAAAKAAMNWGTLHEATAIERYKSVMGQDGSLGFAVHADSQYGWLGASPDGLLDPEGGILEVKCPYNKGKPDIGLPCRPVLLHASDTRSDGDPGQELG